MVTDRVRGHRHLYISLFVVLVELIYMFISFVSTPVAGMHFKVHYGNKIIVLVQFLFSAPFYGIFTYTFKKI